MGFRRRPKASPPRSSPDACCLSNRLNVLLLVSSDGRLATASIIIVLFSLIVLNKFSSRWSILYLPAIVAASAAYVHFAGATEGYDNFAGRVAGTMNVLSLLDVQGLA